MIAAPALAQGTAPTPTAPATSKAPEAKPAVKTVKAKKHKKAKHAKATKQMKHARKGGAQVKGAAAKQAPATQTTGSAPKAGN
jgi:hypothetical protein